MKMLDNMMLSRIFPFAITLFVLNACNPENGFEDPSEPIEQGMESLSIPKGFDFSTTQNVNFEMRSPVPNTHFRVEDQAGNMLFDGNTDAEGFFRYAFNVPMDETELIVKATTPGIPSDFSAFIENGNALADFETLAPSSNRSTQSGASTERTTSAIIGNYYSIGTWNSQGRPNYLTTPDQVDSDLLLDISASLPEGRPVPQYNTEYLTEAPMNTKLQALADIWVTFVHEGAGWKNTLGYYTYPLDNPPASVDDIDSLFVIFPNVSFSGSGGGMATGDKVLLGQFPANTGIGWFLIPNSWDAGNQTILDRSQVKFSVHEFNNYTGTDYRQHTILLNDANRELLLLGIEDTTRPGGDNDFNDAIFYVTANPYSAIITDELLEVTEAIDTDEDGVFDHEDDFPEDPQKAYISYKPGSNKWGTLAYEDLWPNKGDYDFNDLVIDFRFEQHLSASRKIQEVKTTLKLKAIGGYFHNGFGIELPLAPSDIANVSGGHYTEGYTQRAANGTEQNQANAVIIAFENAYHLMAAPNGKVLVNAERDGQYVAPVTQVITIDLVDDQVSEGTLSYAPYNPFIIVNRERGREIHLPNKPGTSLANTALFNVGDDDSNSGTPYTTDTNLPWALHMGSGFDYPYENEDITETHLHFGTWAESGGGQYTDWFRNKTGYRNGNKIYQP